MEELEERRLLEEYRANVEMWKHNDMLRQHRISNLLTVNTILLVALGAFLNFMDSLYSIVIISIFLSVFGLLICFIWNSILARNAEYVRFQRYQLRSIEARLPNVTTYTNIFEGFYKLKPVSFIDIDDTFIISPKASSRSTITEKNLPFIIVGFWLLVFITSLIALLALFLGWKVS